jgi:HSP20 family molecular chaperone IbpA
MTSTQTCNGTDQHRALQTEKPHHHITENERSAQITVYLPGVKKSDIRLRFTTGQLELEATRAKREQTEGWTARHREISPRDFALRLSVGKPYDGANAAASFANGVLSVELPLLPALLPKSIPIGGA